MKNRFNLNIGMKQMIFTSASPIDEFYCEKTVCRDNKKVQLRVHVNPLHLLLNQKRLDKLGTMGLEEWLSQFDLKKSTALDELRKQCSDEDLMRVMKSRHLQSPAEILAWSRHMSQNMDDFSKELQSYIDLQTAEQPGSDVESKTE